MKKLLFLATTASVFFFAGCTDQKAEGPSAEAQKNLDAFHAVDTAFQTGDISRIDDVVASDFIDHTPKGDKGRDSLKSMITRMKNAGTIKSEIKKEFADNEYVIAWMRWSGTSNGSIPDMPPAGPFDMNGIEVVRFKDGKAVEHWAFMDAREMMNMMSQQMPSSAPASSDKPK